MGIITRYFPILCVLPLCMAHAQAPDLAALDIVMRSLPPGPVAFIDDEPIPREDFVRFYKARVNALEAKSGTAPDDNTRIGVAIACLSELAQQAFLVAEAERRNIHVSDFEVSEIYKQELERMSVAAAEPGAAPLTEAQVLEKTGQSKAEARAALQRTMRIQKAAEALLAEERVEITDAEIKQFYENNKARFGGPASIHLKQILIKPSPTPRTATDVQWEEASKRINNALARIRGGERFETVAKDVSESPDAQRGGDMGMLPVRENGGAPPFLVEAVKDVSPGGLSKPVRSEYGWHVLQLVARTEAGGTTLASATPQIRQFLEAARGEQALESIIQPILQDPRRVRIYLQLPKSIAATLKSGSGAQ